MKKAQISIFIIIALLLVLSVTIVFIFNRGDLGILRYINKDLSSESGKINSVFHDCIRQRGIDAIRIIGLQGGYVKLPEKFIKINISDVAYGYYEGRKTLPQKGDIEREISSYIELSLPYCIDYNSFPDLNLSIGEPLAKVNIEKNYVRISAKIPISIAKDGKTLVLNEDYNAEIPIKLRDMYDIADEIIDKEISDPNYIQVSYLAGLNYNIMILPQDEKNIVYVITDDSNRSRIDDVSYSFLFANKLK